MHSGPARRHSVLRRIHREHAQHVLSRWSGSSAPLRDAVLAQQRAHAHQERASVVVLARRGASPISSEQTGLIVEGARVELLQTSPVASDASATGLARSGQDRRGRRIGTCSDPQMRPSLGSPSQAGSPGR